MAEPTLRQLLPPPVLFYEAADIARLRAVHTQWSRDSLARLLVYSRLSQDFAALQQADSSIRYLRRAWQLASLAPRRGRPAEQVVLADDLAHYYYVRGAYDSTRYYLQVAMHLFQKAGFDSLHGTNPQRLPTNHLWASGWVLAGALANAGSASRALGELPAALTYLERARVLYQHQHSQSGLLWVQSLLGETYAEQNNYPQAMAAYEQALATARHYPYQQPTARSRALADFILNYYSPLLLARPGQAARVSQLAAEATQALQAAYPPQQVRVEPAIALRLARLSLVSAQAALQAGQRVGALPWLAQARAWLRPITPPSSATATGSTASYASVQALFLGLQAWQQHLTDPAKARLLLTAAAALLARSSPINPPRTEREQLARYCLAMGEPSWAVQLLRPLLRTYQRPRAQQPLSQVTGLLTQAYAGLGRYDSAYFYGQRTQQLLDTLRQARQFAALVATEARFRSREQAGRIALLTRLSQQQARYVRLAAAGALLLALLALVASLAWRTTRRLNGRLASQARQLQAQATRLGELDAAKNQFFANVSHELRTPLTLMLGPLGGLLDAAGPLLSPPVREPIAVAHRHARRLLELVNRILDLTKLDVGRLALQPAPTIIGPWLRQIVSQFEALAVERGITLVAPAGAMPAGPLLFDAGKAEQILTNLLINALNYTPAGGAVLVTAALPDPTGQYSITVRDTGPGLTEAEQMRVFERYYQAPQAMVQGGTGLGLALSRELATLLGGSLMLTSELGQGAAFTLRFPAEVLPAAAEVVASLAVETALGLAGAASLLVATAPDELTQGFVPNALPPTSGLKSGQAIRSQVLVVEDEPDLRQYLRQLLMQAGYEVLAAADGQAALDILTAAPPLDLVVTDAMMPRLSGTALLTQLRANPAQASLPVLMLTARADDTHRQQALAVGVDDYLTKPFAASELLARTRALLARHQVRRHFAAQPAEEAGMEMHSPPPTSRPTPIAMAAAAAPEVATQLAHWQAQVAGALRDPAFGPAELAAQLNLSERSLYRRLGELAGLTPAAWLSELRLTHARQLLEAGDFGTVAAVAEAAGFANVKSFSQRYAARFGKRPNGYRA